MNKLNKIKSFFRSKGTFVIELLLVYIFGFRDYTSQTPYMVAMVIFIFSIITHQKLIRKFVEEE